MQEGLCGLCWYPLQENLSTDHILPQIWHDKLGKPDKDRWDNLQATHVDCNHKKRSYPSPWHRHTLRMCLATVRGEALDTESLLWKLAGEKPEPQNTPIVQGPEWVHLSSAFGLVVPYIHKYFNDQGLRVPARIRSDQFTEQFAEWMNTEPMRTWHHNERAIMYAQAPEMLSRAAEHVFRLSLPGYVRGELTMRPGFTVPADAKGPPVGIRKAVGMALFGAITAIPGTIVFNKCKRRYQAARTLRVRPVVKRSPSSGTPPPLLAFAQVSYLQM